MEQINNILKNIPFELRNSLYSFWSTVLFFVVLSSVFICYMLKNKKLAIWKYAIVIAIPFSTNILLVSLFKSIQKVLLLDFSVTFIVCFIIS